MMRRSSTSKIAYRVTRLHAVLYIGLVVVSVVSVVAQDAPAITNLEESGPAYVSGRWLVYSVSEAFRDDDLNGDGFRDLVLGDAASRSLAVFRSLGCAAPPRLRRGDVDQNGRVELTDAIRTLDHLFLSFAELLCPDAADVDDSGSLDVTDAIALLLYLFLDGAPPAEPGGQGCGPDPTTDPLRGCVGACS